MEDPVSWYCGCGQKVKQEGRAGEFDDFSEQAWKGYRFDKGSEERQMTWSLLSSKHDRNPDSSKWKSTESGGRQRHQQVGVVSNPDNGEIVSSR